jgi:hypothetical protein
MFGKIGVGALARLGQGKHHVPAVCRNLGAFQKSTLLKLCDGEADLGFVNCGAVANFARGHAAIALQMEQHMPLRAYGADENILNSSRATDFMTPKPHVSKVFRNAVLDLAGKHAFARPLVNSGRLSVPSVYDGFAMFGPDALDGPAVSRVGAACPDAPVAWLSSGFAGRFA